MKVVSFAGKGLQKAVAKQSLEELSGGSHLDHPEFP